MKPSSPACLEHDAKAKDKGLGWQEVLASPDHEGAGRQVLASGGRLGHLRAMVEMQQLGAQGTSLQRSHRQGEGWHSRGQRTQGA